MKTEAEIRDSLVNWKAIAEAEDVAALNKRQAKEWKETRQKASFYAAALEWVLN